MLPGGKACVDGCPHRSSVLLTPLVLDEGHYCVMILRGTSAAGNTVPARSATEGFEQVTRRHAPTATYFLCTTDCEPLTKLRAYDGLVTPYYVLISTGAWDEQGQDYGRCAETALAYNIAIVLAIVLAGLFIRCVG